MCDECEYCYRAASLAGELREESPGVLICSDCFDGSEAEWLTMTTADEAAEMFVAMIDDKAHAIRDRRAGL